jgi:hypothetical protein
MPITQTPVPPFPTEERVRADARLMLSEITDILTRMSNQLMRFTTMQGRPGAELRVAIGIMLTNIGRAVSDATLPDEMANVFDAAYDAGIQLSGVEPALASLRSELPTTNGSVWTTQAAIMYALATECRVIADMSFRCREDVEKIQGQMKLNFDMAKEWAADEMDNVVYGRLVDLAAKLARYLADVALPLPTVVYYNLKPVPALAWSYRIYADANRTEELMADNRVIHPLFMRELVRALSQ